MVISQDNVTSWCVLLLLPLQPGNLFIMAAGRKRRRRRDRDVFERCKCVHDVHSCVSRTTFHDLLLVVVFLLCFFMRELADVGTG